MLTLKPHIGKTRNIPFPNEYVKALEGDLKDFAFSEERVLKNKGNWHQVFGVSASHPIDLEIGTGNGNFFAHRACSYPGRCLLGFELKYKPLIQSIRRALREGMKNARVVRYHAQFLEQVIAAREIENVFLHFPDPWEKRRTKKNRLIQSNFLTNLSQLQKPGSFLEFKTDSRDYFDHALDVFKTSPYQLEVMSYDLHASASLADTNFVTAFEQIFLRENKPINYAKLWI